MCGEDFFLSLKANSELFNFIQQATLLLTFASALLSFFAFRNMGGVEGGEGGFQEMQIILQRISIGLWAFSGTLILTVLNAYFWESRYQATKNAWGETIYNRRSLKYSQSHVHDGSVVDSTKKMKRQKSGRNKTNSSNSNKNNPNRLLLFSSPSSSTYGGSQNTPSLRSIGASPANMSPNDVIVDVHQASAGVTII